MLKNQREIKNKGDDWMPTLIGALAAVSTSLIAIIILIFFHSM